MFEVDHSSINGECENALVVKIRSGGSEKNVMKVFDDCKPKALGIIAYPSKNSLAAALEVAEPYPEEGFASQGIQERKRNVSELSKG